MNLQTCPSLARRAALAAMLVVLPVTLCLAAATDAGYRLEVGVPAGVSVNSLQVDIGYDALPGRLVVRDSEVACTPNPALGALMAFGDCGTGRKSGCTGNKLLSAAIASTEPVTGPVVLFSCEYNDQSAATPDHERLSVRVVEAARRLAGREISNTETSITVRFAQVEE